jgi:DNA-binding NarL/FixJ family response regulator
LAHAAGIHQAKTSHRERTIKILLVDDHGLFREGITLLLKSVDPGIDVLHAGTGADALQQITRERFDMMFLDLGLPDRPGLEVLTELKALAPELPVVVLSGHEERDTVLDAIRRGAMGFIPKSSEDPQLLWHALKMAASGAVTVPASITHSGSGAQPSAPPSARSTTEALGLTSRQWDVLRLLVQGMPNKSIARRLDIAETTARGYVSDLLAAFRVTNRTQLVIEVARRGIDTSPPASAQ